MFFVNLRGARAQRAIHEHREARQFPGADQFVQHIDDLLRASDGERRDDDLAVLPDGFVDEPADNGVGINPHGVFAAAVSGFNLEVVHVLDRQRVAQQFIAAPANVAAKQIAKFSRAFLHVENHLRGTDDVPGIAERHGHAGHGLKRLLVSHANELGHGLLGVGGGVKRRDGRQIFPRADFGDKNGVLFLDVRRVQEHDAAQVARGGRAMDFSGVTLLDEVRQLARVIHVRVA